jgi:YD repeat-containing protein
VAWVRAALGSLRRRRPVLIGLVCVSLIANVFTAIPAQAAANRGPKMPGAPAASRVPKPAPVRRTAMAQAPEQPVKKEPTARTFRPPPAGRASVALDRDYRAAGGLPVALATAPRGAPADAVSAVSKVEVSTLDPTAVDRIGGRSIGFQLRRGDGGQASGPVQVRVDTSSIADEFGGGFAARLRLVRYPGCVLSTPENPACATPTLVPSTANPVTKQVTAIVDAAPTLATPVLAANAATTPVFALTSTAGASDAGSFKATPLKGSDFWAVGEQSGSFTYSYPLPAAPSTGGDTPSLALSYDSGSVDGLTSKENNQSSPVGLGWDLGIPFVEQRFKSCTKSGIVGNLCWSGGTSTTGGNFVLSLDGHASALNFLSTSGGRDQFAMQDDQGWQVEQVHAGTSANPNGDFDGIYWKVTVNDGTQYYFGRENTDWATSLTNSAEIVPMYAQNSGERCYDKSGHVCNTAWRWNLAYVVDPVGNLQSYLYEKARYSYQVSGASVQHYDGAAYLTTVKYGKTSTNTLSVTAPQRIDLTYDWRCDFEGCRAPVPHDNFAADYPDVPFDLWCADTATSCPSGPTSPAFFFLKRLSSVTSNVYNGSGYTPVDRVDLTVEWPQFQSQSWSTVMWLRSLAKTGYSPSGATLTLPKVKFGGEYETWPANRLEINSNGNYQNKPRITDVFNELGGQAHVHYDQPNACTASALWGHEDSQTSDCFPAIVEDGDEDWFQRYLVTRLEVIDQYGAPKQTTTYDYDTATGAAWHSDNDPITPAAKQTWGDYRGYSKVTIHEGTPGGQVTTTEKQYFRGMHGDHNKDGSTKTVALWTAASPDPTGGIDYQDYFYRKGLLLEERTLRSDGSEIDDTQHKYTKTIINPGPAGPWGLFLNGQVQIRESTTKEMLTAGGVVRKYKHFIDRTYDPTYGLPVSTQDEGDPVSGVGPTCDYTTYSRNTDLHIVDTEATQVTATGMCPADGSAPAAANLIGRTDTYYDANFTNLTAAPTAGLPVKVVKWASASGTADPATAITASKYDDHGRVVASIAPDNFVASANSFDTAGPATTTTFTAPNGPITGASVTNPAGHVTSLVLDPGLALPLSTMDANGRTTTLTYDPLGRLTNVRLPGDSYDAKTFSYAVSNTAPSMVVSAEYPAAGASPIQTWQFVDSLGRTFQTQTTSPTGGILTTGTRYDDRGHPAATVAPFGGPGTPGTAYGQWYDPAFTATLPSQTVTTYDDADRMVTSSLISLGVTRRTTTTSYFALKK